MAHAAVEAKASSSPEPGSPPRPGTSRIASEAAVLSAITLYAYFCAYLFEAGHSIPFGYPAELIGPTLYSLQGGWPVIIVFYLFGFLQLNLQYWPGYGRWTAGFVVILALFIAAILTLSAFLPSWAPYIELGSAIIAGGVNALHNRQLRRAKSGRGKDAGLSMSPEFSGIFTVFDARSSIPRGTIAHRLIAPRGFDPLAPMLLLGIIVPALAGLAGFTQAKRAIHVLRYPHARQRSARAGGAHRRRRYHLSAVQSGSQYLPIRVPPSAGV